MQIFTQLKIAVKDTTHGSRNAALQKESRELPKQNQMYAISLFKKGLYPDLLKRVNVFQEFFK